jgi:hypothetical protein
VANGCVGPPVRFCDVWQQDLLAQQAGAQAFWLGAFSRMHVAEVERSDATIIAAASASETVILLNIS